MMKSRHIVLNHLELENLRDAEVSDLPEASRRRAKAVRLNHEGYTRLEIASILRITYQTVKRWLRAYYKQGILFLHLEHGGGRKHLLLPEHTPKVLAFIKDSPRQIKQVLSRIETELGLSLSKTTLKRFLKKHHLLGNAFAEA